MTWQDHATNLEANLQNLHRRVQRGAYRALPWRRQYIPKPDGGQPPRAVTALEDEIVGRATVTLLNEICEEAFLVQQRIGGRTAAIDDQLARRQ